MRCDSFQKKATGIFPVAQGLIIDYTIITAAVAAILFLVKPITRAAAEMEQIFFALTRCLLMGDPVV